MLYEIKFWTGDVQKVEADSLREAMKASGYHEDDLVKGYHEDDGNGYFHSVYGDWCATVSSCQIDETTDDIAELRAEWQKLAAEVATRMGNHDFANQLESMTESSWMWVRKGRTIEELREMIADARRMLDLQDGESL